MDQPSRVAIVTGAGGGERGGIGAGISRVLARHGCHIVATDLTEDAADATASQIRRAGGSASSLVTDVTDPNALTLMVDKVVRDNGRLDILVNNAGITGSHGGESITDSEWDSVLAVNLNGPFYASRAAIPYLVKSGNGRIINVASIAGLRIAQLGGPAYTASKAGLLGLTRHLAVELASRGVTVNAVCPGLTLTPLVREGTASRGLDEAIESVPALSAGTPDDIGELVSFLSSPAAHYITGVQVTHDGGKSALQGDYSSWKRSYPMS